MAKLSQETNPDTMTDEPSSQEESIDRPESGPSISESQQKLQDIMSKNNLPIITPGKNYGDEIMDAILRQTDKKRYDGAHIRYLLALVQQAVSLVWGGFFVFFKLSFPNITCTLDK